MPADHLRVDLGAGQEGQQDGAEAREEVDPWRERQANEIAGDCADHDLDQRDRYRDPDRQHGCDEREPYPQGRCEPNGAHCVLLAVPRRAARHLVHSDAEDAIDPTASCAVGVISPVGRFWGTPSP